MEKKRLKKDFWNMSWNPVHGCKYGCVYCYAKRIDYRCAEKFAEKEMDYHYKEYWKCHNDLKHNHERLYKSLKAFRPTWLESNYVRKFPRKPSIIFVNSMSDPVYWEESWYEKILKRITENMQHTFVVLTKQPRIYEEYTFPHNTILGVSVTNQLTLNQFECDLSNWFDPQNRLLLSIEPIQEKIIFKGFMEWLIKNNHIDWIHVGEESGNRKGHIRATKEMIDPFFNLKDIPVFMKDNLSRLYPQLRKEFPAL